MKLDFDFVKFSQFQTLGLETVSESQKKNAEVEVGVKVSRFFLYRSTAWK